jgi:hypothetical protein
MKHLKKHFKTCFIIWLICLSNFKANSQVIIALLFGDKLNSDKLEFGLSGGLSQSDISNFPGAESKSGFNLGLYLNMKLSDDWFLRIEAVPKFPTGVAELKPYTLNNASLDSLLSGGTVVRKIQNIALPVLIRYKIKNLLVAETGPQLNLRTKAKDFFESGDLSYKNNIQENFTRFDFGWAIGLSRKLNKNVTSAALGLRYYIGLTDVDKVTPNAQKNGVFQVLFSIPVGVGKQKSKEKTE